MQAIRKLKNGKAAGVCGILPEMLKLGGTTAEGWLVQLFNLVWEEGVVPMD